MLNTELARQNMLDGQIRPWQVFDERVLATMNEIPRERFVPERFQSLAYADWEIPLGHGQVMTPPKIIGRILESLVLAPGERVLEIGTGSGYLTACLARLGTHVTSIDYYESFVESARGRLHALGLGARVTLATCDAMKQLPDGPFDAITITAALGIMQDRFTHLLKPGGRMFAVVGNAPAMQAIFVQREGEPGFATKPLFETRLPGMIHDPIHENLQL